MFLLLCALLTLADKVEVIQPLAASKSDQLEVQSGGLVFREGEAGAAFGAVQVGKGKRQFSYFLVVKHDIGTAEKSEFGEEANATDGEGETKQTITIEGRTLEVVYKLSVEAGKKKGESLTLNKKAIDLSKGRVLLVDMTPGGPKWEQSKAELPGDVAAATKKAADDLAKKTLAALAKDRKVKEFIDKAGK